MLIMKEIRIKKGNRNRKAFRTNCGYCGKEIVRETRDRKTKSGKHYCDVSCSNSDLLRNRVKLSCSYCGKEIEKAPSKIRASRSGHLFCDRNCKDLASRLYQNNTVWDMLPEHYGTSKTRYRDYALREYGSKCQKCGYDKNPAALTVHHKDRNRSNNSMDNLEVLCANCHAIEHYEDGSYK